MGKIKRSKNFIVPLVVYPFDIMFSLGETDEQLRKVFAKHGIQERNYFEHELKVGRCSIFPDGSQVVRLRDYPSTNAQYGYLQHEIFHAVANLMEKIGVRLLNDYSDEAYAYLIAYLTKEVYKHL